MAYIIRWNSLDGTGDNGYLRSFPFGEFSEACRYAEAYARSVGELTFVETATETVWIAEKATGYRERIYIVSQDVT